jgi:hypothetical protein
VKESRTGVEDSEESSRDVEEPSRDADEAGRVERGVEGGSSRSTTTKLKGRKRKLAQKMALRKRRKTASEEGFERLVS